MANHEDLSHLESIKLGDWVFAGNSSHSTSGQKPYYFTNTLTMKSATKENDDQQISLR